MKQGIIVLAIVASLFFAGCTQQPEAIEGDIKIGGGGQSGGPTTTASGGDKNPPTISDVYVDSNSIGTTVATIHWTVTDAHTIVESRVIYFLEGVKAETEKKFGAGIKSHTLIGLVPGSTYTFHITAIDGAKNAAKSANATFTTASTADLSPPTLGDVAAQVSHDSAILEWSVDDDSTQVESWAEFGSDSNYGQQTTIRQGRGTHRETVGGLSTGSSYHYRIRVRDAAGHGVDSEDRTFTTLSAADTTPPVIADFAVAGTSDKTATLSWRVDDASQSSTNKLLYGPTSQYGSTLELAPGVGLKSVTIQNLQPSSTYRARATARDNAGNTIQSDEITFTTTSGPETTPPTITAVTNLQPTLNGATLKWTVSDNSGFVRSRAFWGESNPPTTATPYKEEAGEKQVGLTGLKSGTKYFYFIEAVDGGGNKAQSEVKSFTTKTPEVITLAIRDVGTQSTGTSITFRWRIVNPDNQVTSQLSYNQGAGNTPIQTPARPGTGSHEVTVTGLRPQTNYIFRVTATNATTTIQTNDANAVTGAPPMTVQISSTSMTGPDTEGVFTMADNTGYTQMVPPAPCPNAADVQPQIVLSNLPPGTTHLALHMYDTDPSTGGYKHWMFWNLPITAPSFTLAQNADVVSMGARIRSSTDGVAGYEGPWPGPGVTHVYEFKVWALHEPSPAANQALWDSVVEPSFFGRTLATGTVLAKYTC